MDNDHVLSEPLCPPRIRSLLVIMLVGSGLGLTPGIAAAAEALLSSRDQSQVHTWDSQAPGESVLLHSVKCNDADINLPEGTSFGWIAEHFDDHFGRFIIGSDNGLETQYNLGQNGLTAYNYPKHISAFNGEIVVMSRNDGTLWRYSPEGQQLGSVKTSSSTGQGLATDGVDLYVSLWDGAVSSFVRYDAAFAVLEEIANPTGLGGASNIFDMIYDSQTDHFFGLATSGESGTGTQSTTVVEFEMGGAVVDSFTIPFPADGIGALIQTSCGDGIVDEGEACDDGNNVDTDDCTSACEEATCGDGFIHDGVEPCDDGNGVDTDACTNVCKEAECGDGIVQEGVEACDDGNDVDDDECTNACVIQECGNGVIEGAEECDDGNENDLDGCTNSCMSMLCGNGVLDPGEECDDGNTIDNDGCPSNCIPHECGDGVVEEGTECDDGNTVDDDGCTNACTLPVCGDGVIQRQEGEECDDGNSENDDACSNLCTAPVCGDGIIQGNEECDEPGDPWCVDCIPVDGMSTGETDGGGSSGGETSGASDSASSSTGGGETDGSSTGDSATAGESDGGIDVSGCSCRDEGGDGSELVGVLALLGLLVNRRRRRAS